MRSSSYNIYKLKKLIILMRRYYLNTSSGFILKGLVATVYGVLEVA